MNRIKTPFEIENVSRRSFLKGVSATGALVLAARWDSSIAQDKKVYGGAGMANGLRDDPTIFVSLGTDGMVTITNHRAEMGQGIRTSVVMVIADEMGADWQKVKVQQANGNEAKYGNQNTDGSRSMRHWFEPLCRVGAAIRLMLEQAAANTWDVPVSECKVSIHKVEHEKSGRTLSFGDLAKKAASQPIPSTESLILKKQKDWRYIMREPTQFNVKDRDDMPLAIDGWDIVQGKALFAADMSWDNMLYAVIARPLSYGSTVKSVDDTDALKVPGVVKVLQLPTATKPSVFNPLGGVAVLATNTWAAIKGRSQLKIEWDDAPAGDNAHYDSTAFKAEMEKTAILPGKTSRNQGNVKKNFENAKQHISVNYYAPHMAQAPMEPPAAMARIIDGKAEIWTSVQNPQLAVDGVAKILNVKPTEVTVRCSLLGGGFGRKSKPDYVFEAAMLSNMMNGQAVRVQWTREDDIHHSFFHTVSLEHLEASLNDEGKVTGWLHRSVSPTITALFGPDSGHQAPFELGMGIRNMPFDVEAIRQESGEALAHVRIGWFRAVYNVPHAFAIQCFVAELAHAAGKDHKVFLLDLLGKPRKVDPISQGADWNYGENPEHYPIDIGRFRDVILRATEEAGWGKKLPKNRGLGLAVHHSFVSYCAVVMDVEVTETGKVIVHRADVAFDCGPQINPERVRSQMEGACIMGTGIALMTEITAKDGKIVQGNFDDYLVPRIHESPKEIHVYAVNSNLDVPIGGAGEPGLPPVAPALVNAIFAATGKRIRTLPVADQLAVTKS